MTVLGEDIDERVRDRAYYLWVAEGRPSGLDHDFWHRAAAIERAARDCPPDDPRADASKGAAHSQGLGSETKPFSTPPGLGFSHDADPVTGIAFTRLSNGDARAAPGGPTQGYSIRLPDEVEAAASGKHISVRVVARAAGAAESRFAIAYSTNEVGNSGWRWFAAGSAWSTREMKYQVPVMKQGKGDFVGILPDAEGRPGVEVCFLAIDIS